MITWTPNVCRIVAFYGLWGHYFAYFWGFRLGKGWNLGFRIFGFRV